MTELEPLVAHPSDHEDLARLVRSSLLDLFGRAPEEYEQGRFLIEVENLEFMVLATQAAFPAVRFHHRVFDADEGVREELIHFANALHGRSSSLGSHW